LLDIGIKCDKLTGICILQLAHRTCLICAQESKKLRHWPASLAQLSSMLM
jgi:hypothetical protein